MRIFKNNSGVSHLVGYMLTLSLTTVIIAVTIITTNALIDNKARDAAEIYAENIANQVANAIINVCVLKEQYPNVNYSTVLEIPLKLVDRIPYYIKIDKSTAYVNSSDGSIREKSTIYNATYRQAINISGTIYSSFGAINISCDSYNYVYKFDFGTNTSTGSTGYTRLTNASNNNLWNANLKEWKYRTPIIIKNPVGKTLTNYQVLIQLDDTNFDYSLANSNGSDLRFINRTGKMLNYWIERWYPRDTHTSRIWVNLTSLLHPEDIIFMYYGNVSASPKSNGEGTFVFFDDFSSSLTKWNQYNPLGTEINIMDGELVLTNGSAVNSTKQIGLSPCVIEAKAKTIGDGREASMFARSSASSGAPYSHAYLFASGNFTAAKKKNLSILKDNTLPPINSSNLPVNQEWNRLTYIINRSDTIVCRYFYENYSVDGRLSDPYASASGSYLGNNHFGLCTTEINTIAYYDWVFVRKFEANVSESVTSQEESVPVAYVGGTDSRDFKWVNPSNVKSVVCAAQGIDYDFVCNSTNSGAAFTVMNLTNEVHSLVFTVGDPNRVVEGMTIRINGDVPFNVPRCDNSSKKILISDIVPVPVGGNLQIEIEFGDTTPANYYWAVGDLTIQRGKRIINVSGGK